MIILPINYKFQRVVLPAIERLVQPMGEAEQSNKG